MNETLLSEAHYYHALAVAARGGYATMKKYRRAGGGGWEAAYRALEKNFLFTEDGAPLPDPRTEFARMRAMGIRLALASDAEYPDALRHISYPPFGIYLRGGAMAPAVLPSADGTAPGGIGTLAVVGTRRAGADGKKIARSFARGLAAAGFTIASGLAFGIDGAAHEGALDAGGATIAVLAGGLDDIYPRSHRALAERILESGGTLVSEYPPGEAPFAYRFIERNRIMSGISRGVLIVEAPESSGALATARYAAEQDREVFVVPGAITASHFNGSHTLIRQGAELVTTPDDILEAYGMDKKENAAERADGSSPEENLILKALAGTSAAADVDKLIALTRLEPRIVSQTLSFLLIRGIVKETDVGYILETNY